MASGVELTLKAVAVTLAAGFALPAALLVLAPAETSARGDGLSPLQAGFGWSLFYAVLLGALPGAFAAWALQAWRDARRTPPLGIAGVFAAALAVCGGGAVALLWGDQPRASDLVLIPGAVAVACAAAAWAATRDAPATVAAFLASFPAVGLPLSFLAAGSPFGTLTLAVLGSVLVAAVAGAGAFQLVDLACARGRARQEAAA